MVQQESSSATPLWTWRELSQCLGLNPESGPDVFRINTDSRTSKPGDLFVALPGEPGPRFNASYRSDVDGHDYAQNAISRGAVGALVHRDIDLPTPKLVVTDTYDGLWRLGSQAAARMTGTRFAITGSSGKTTAKSFLRAALDAYSAPGSFNNHLGVPLSLSNMPRDADFGVFEVGTNHPGEILPLAELVQPHVAIVLNVGVAHIENFANQAALRDEKLSIFKTLNDPRKLACYAGVAPFPYASGTSIKGREKVSPFANKELKALLHLCAVSLLKMKNTFSDFIERKKKQGKHIMSILNALRNKILHTICACVRKNEKYEKNYTNSLA